MITPLLGITTPYTSTASELYTGEDVGLRESSKTDTILVREKMRLSPGMCTYAGITYKYLLRSTLKRRTI